MSLYYTNEVQRPSAHTSARVYMNDIVYLEHTCIFHRTSAQRQMCDRINNHTTQQWTREHTHKPGSPTRRPPMAEPAEQVTPASVRLTCKPRVSPLLSGRAVCVCMGRYTTNKKTRKSHTVTDARIQRDPMYYYLTTTHRIHQYRRVDNGRRRHRLGLPIASCVRQ